MAKKTPEEDRELKIANAIQHWHTVGHPEHAATIERAVEAGKEPHPKLMNIGSVSPERVIDASDIEIPPRVGKGSGKDVWAEFALQVSDLEPEIVERMSRDDVIKSLEIKGIIPKDGEDK